MTVAIRARLLHLASQPEDLRAAESLLGEAQYLLSLFKTTEARQVARALGDPRFPFGMIQEELAALRKAFASRVRDLATAQPFGVAERDELLEMALLAEEAPLTNAEDLEAIRAARSERLSAVS